MLTASVALVLALAFESRAEGGNADRDLPHAVKSDADSATIRALLEQGADVNAGDSGGATALLWAAQWDNVTTARLLIGAGAEVDAANDYGMTPLLMACTNGSAAMVTLLLDAAARPNQVDPSGVTPLMTAARVGNADVVRTLILHNADLHAQERLLGQTALMWAASEEHLDVVRVLLESGADPHVASASGFTPLLFAARQGNVPLVQLFLDHGVDINYAPPPPPRDDTPASSPRAAPRGAPECCASALHVATLRGHIELALMLLDQGADPNAMGPGYTPLHWAVSRAESAFVRDYAAVEGGEWSVLGGISDRNSKITLINALLTQGADVNARMTKSPPRFGAIGLAAISYAGGGSWAGATPLILAAVVADVEIMRLLVANGADPSLTTADGVTVLMAAAGFGLVEEETTTAEDAQLEAITLCLAWGHDVNTVNSAGNAALHTAALLGRNRVVQLLADNGAKLEQENETGRTPMMIAEQTLRGGMLALYHPDTVELLRELGAAR